MDFTLRKAVVIWYVSFLDDGMMGSILIISAQTQASYRLLETGIGIGLLGFGVAGVLATSSWMLKVMDII